MKSLVIPIVGLPNVGKSSIVNAVLERKVSIVTHKKHTTRTMIFGSRQFDDTEVVFVDTPGFEKVNTKLGTVIFNSMKEYLASLDEMLLILDASKPEIEKFEPLISKSIVVLNKIDRVRKPKLLPIVAQLQSLGAKEIFFTCAQSHDGIKELRNYLKDKIQEQEEHNYDATPEDVINFACECVREKILISFEQEIPYKVWVQPTHVHLPKNSAWKLELDIIVPKASYKPILVGKNGAQIKAISIAARAELNAKLGHSGFLRLDVKIDEKLWERDATYQQLGWLKK